ncbi:GNAT family N-acetyltransferase [Eubacteriales bacterium OttesenSCG-928-M02]|nr:GNAT family N-acetyltransferase [Eubacteriales bacterium OttesenSCG-928-M02]
MEICYKRVGSSADAARVAAAAKEIWEEYYTPLLGETQVAYMLKTMQSEGAIWQQIGDGMAYTLVECGEEVAGYYATKRIEDRLFLSKMYLRRAHRGKGIFRQVLDRLLADAKGCKSIYLTVNRGNEDSIAAYQRLGFAIVAEEKGDIGQGYVMDDYIMEYPLG